MKNSNPFSVFILSFFFLFSIFISPSQSAAAKDSAEIKLALNWKAEPQFGGFYAADKNGDYKKANLNVKILEGGSGTPTIQMLSSGKVDYAVVSADEIILSHDRGAKDLVAVYASFQINPQAILTRAERNFKSIEDVFRSDGTLLWQAGLPYAQYIVKKYGPLKVKTAPYLGGIGNFQNDPQISQQCFVTSEPLLAEKAGLKVKSFLVADAGYNPYTTVLAVRASTLKEKPLEVQKMVDAVRSGWSAYLKNPKDTNAWMGTLNKAMDSSTFEKSAQAQTELIQVKSGKLGSMTTERWQTLSDQLLELKLIKNKILAQDLFKNL